MVCGQTEFKTYFERDVVNKHVDNCFIEMFNKLLKKANELGTHSQIIENTYLHVRTLMITPYYEQSTPKSSDGRKVGQTDLIFSCKITVIPDKRLQFTEWTSGTNKLTPQCIVTLITVC